MRGQRTRQIGRQVDQELEGRGTALAAQRDGDERRKVPAGAVSADGDA